MNYRQMLDQFEYLDKRLAHLELENRYLKERLNKLEYTMIKPKFTPGTKPEVVWPDNFWITTKDST